eukprot:4607683-Karenia_brevis.AAC.1
MVNQTDNKLGQAKFAELWQVEQSALKQKFGDGWFLGHFFNYVVNQHGWANCKCEGCRTRRSTGAQDK